MPKAKTDGTAASGADQASPLPEDFAADAPAAPRTVHARVLAQCDLGQPNDVIEVDPELARARAGVLDTDPAAVAYAATLHKD